jgi:CheY-like chemotaxis protein
LVLMIYAPDGGGYGEYLQGSGFRVAEAQTGEQGFEQAVTLLPDLIVLDFGLNSDLVGAAATRDDDQRHSNHRARLTSARCMSAAPARARLNEERRHERAGHGPRSCRVRAHPRSAG